MLDAKLLPNAAIVDKSKSKASVKLSDVVKEEDKVPDLTSLDSDLLKKKYSGAISSLYNGIQCATCGNRFNQHENVNTSGTANSRYSKHLDWHFRQNKKEKDEINKAHSRDWYYSLSDWILYEELSEETASQTLESESNGSAYPSHHEAGAEKNSYESDQNHLSLNSVFDQSSRDLRNFNSTGTKTCPATDDIGDSCCICEDPFEIFWFEEREEWHFRDAIRVDNRIYHPICFEDARDVSIIIFG